MNQKTLVLLITEDEKHAWMASSEDLTDEMRQWLCAASGTGYECLDADVRGFLTHPNWDDEYQYDDPADRLRFVRARALADRVFPVERRGAGAGPVEAAPGESIEYVYTIIFHM